MGKCFSVIMEESAVGNNFTECSRRNQFVISFRLVLHLSVASLPLILSLIFYVKDEISSKAALEPWLAFKGT